MSEVVPPLVDTAMTSGRGEGKLSPEAMADAIAHGEARGRRTIAPGFARRVLWLERCLPALVERAVARS